MDIRTIKGNLLRRTEALNSYLKEISKYPILTPNEETELLFQMKNGDDKAREKLINCNQRFVFAIAKRYASDDTVLDLVDEGNLGLMTAIEKYDDTKGVRFLSYAVWYIRRAITYYLANDNVLIKRTNNMRLSGKLNKIKNKFYCENGRMPSDDEIISFIKDDFNIDIQKQCDVFDITSESINDFLDEEDNTIEKSQDYNSKTASYNDYETTIENDYNANIVNKLLSTLSERDREIVKMAFGIGYKDSYSNDIIGERFGLCAERVRQIVIKATKKMETAFKYMNR